MADVLNLVGKKYPATESYLVGREKIREFARSIFAEDPLHFDLDAALAAGYADLVAPTTFAMVVQVRALEQFLSDPEANIDLSRVVHGDQRFSYQRPIVAGDELSGIFTVHAVRKLGANFMVSAEVNIVDQAGQSVVNCLSTLMIGGE
ncbi:MAG: MaoC family dehydratase N-terminal domain-containing protein [Microbacteriaceae bacterium]